jgi:hypothetical protein
MLLSIGADHRPRRRGTVQRARRFFLRKEVTMPRELIHTGTDKRFVRRDENGKFKESDDVGRSLAADRRQHAKAKTKKGEGGRGDR